jgi:aspartyl-tRNA(Asn)/glutamyl-tRNA(Gln) amidotransferase subunit A
MLTPRNSIPHEHWENRQNRKYSDSALSDTIEQRESPQPHTTGRGEVIRMPYKSIREAAEEIHAGLITPAELVLETLARIDEQDSMIQAYVTIMREQALEEAERAEREIRTGLYRGLLHGIPLAIKDIIAVKGVRLTAGSKVLANFTASEDATVVGLLRKKGAIILGKTSTFEFAYGPYSPPTCNPWDHTRTTGGSSGGSAAAVVAGMCLGALGSDTGGSIRIPSACCGATGLKPTYGAVSCYGVIPLSWSLDHVGPIGRSAEDCALLFDAIAGYDPRDPNSVSRPPSKTHKTLSARSALGEASLQGLRLGLPQDAFINPLDPEVRLAWKGAVMVLKEAGAQVHDVELPRATLATYRGVQKPEATLAHIEKGWLTEKLDLYGEPARTRLLEGQEIKAVDYLQAQRQRRTFSSSLRTAMQGLDALVLPTQPIPAVQIAQMGQEITIDGAKENATEAMLRLTMPFNLAGLPAISLPCGFSSGGLPIGLQLVGKPFEEAMILRIAHTYQQMTDWHHREIKAS